MAAAHDLFLRKPTGIPKAEDQEKQGEEEQTNQRGDEGSNDPTDAGEHGAGAKPNIPERQKKVTKFSKF